ncbi:unnamed protein product [Calypogeia fissa]
MTANGMESRTGSAVKFTDANNVAEVVVDDHDDYPKLVERSSERELKRARSAVDLAIPWLVWPVFIISIVVGASSSPIVVGMERAAPVSLGGWRHQVTSLAMLPFSIFEWRKMQKPDRAKSSNSFGLYLLSALFISGHIAFAYWALAHTSMIHAIFLCAISPVFVAVYTKLRGGPLMTVELIGVTLGVIGVAVLAAGTGVERDAQSTYIGDFIALCASVFMAGFLIVGKKLRSWIGWMPLFVYQFPVTVLSAIILGTFGLLLEGWNSSGHGNISGLFGWFRKDYFLPTIFLAIGPGLVGQAGYSFVLRYSSPLVMPTGLSLQPVISSLIGWAVGQFPIPGMMTILGGTVTLGGTLFVSCAGAKKKKQQPKESEEYKQPATDDEEAQQGTKPLLQPSDSP